MAGIVNFWPSTTCKCHLQYTVTINGDIKDWKMIKVCKEHEALAAQRQIDDAVDENKRIMSVYSMVSAQVERGDFAYEYKPGVGGRKLHVTLPGSFTIGDKSTLQAQCDGLVGSDKVQIE